MPKKAGMTSHQRKKMGKDEWLTPPEILFSLGSFDLDPCTPIDPPWATAARMLTVKDDGLAHPWHGRVWLNPPYNHHTKRWLRRLVEHGTGTALIFARTETQTWHDWVWPHADAIFFFRGRLHFHHRDGSRAEYNGGAPSALIAYGPGDAERLANFNLPGRLVYPKTQQ